MKDLSRGTRSLLISALVAAAIAAVVLPLFAVASQGNLQSAARDADAATARARASLFSSLYQSDIRAARDLTDAPSVTAFHQNLVNRQLTWPEITGAYLLRRDGALHFGLWLNPIGTAAVVDSVPSGLAASDKTALGRALLRTLQHDAESYVFSFGPGSGPMGALYLLEPVTNLANEVTGAVVLRVDNQILLGRYIANDNVLLVAPPFVVGNATAGLVAHNQVSVLAGLPATMQGDASLFGGKAPVTTSSLSPGQSGASGMITYMGAGRVAGASALDTLPGFQVIVHSAPPTFGSALQQVVAGGAGVALIILLMAGVAFLFVYQERRITAATALIEESKSRLLTGDILNVSEALSTAREGDLTVEVPNAESEVGLVSVLINGLLHDYSQIVAGIIRASRAVQDGARRVDSSVRSIVEIAARQSGEMTATAGTVEALAGSASTVRRATLQATELASEASRSVQLGQDAVTRIGEAVDSIKEAAIGTTREFKRLQEDSIRLTALVSSVKSNAENLDMHAANAALEARHLGTETGSAFATNIGRLARQAQETLADAETAVRSVVGSIDAVNRRIERISEQVRLGVDEVRSVRANFDDITTTNHSLVQFIEQVAGSTEAQATNAQQAAASISAMAATFRQFNELLISSSDEMAHMRLIVADLQESVSNLKVEETLLVEGDDTAATELAA